MRKNAAWHAEIIFLLPVETRELCYVWMKGAVSILGKWVRLTCFWGKKRFSLTAAFWITRIKMDDVYLVIHFNRFVFAEKGRGHVLLKMGYTTYPDKKYASFRYQYYKREEELPPCDIDRMTLLMKKKKNLQKSVVLWEKVSRRMKMQDVEAYRLSIRGRR